MSYTPNQYNPDYLSPFDDEDDAPDATEDPTPMTSQPVPSITITHQMNASAAYRVEIKDASSYGLGYGKTPRMAYADAREDYQAYRNSQTRMALKTADAEFKAGQ